MRTPRLNEPESLPLVPQGLPWQAMRPYCLHARESMCFLSARAHQQRPGASTGGDLKTRDARTRGASWESQLIIPTAKMGSGTSQLSTGPGRRPV